MIEVVATTNKEVKQRSNNSSKIRDNICFKDNLKFVLFLTGQCGRLGGWDQCGKLVHTSVIRCWK